MVHKHNVVQIDEQIESVYLMDELEQATQLIESAQTICTHLRDQLSALRAWHSVLDLFLINVPRVPQD